MYPTPTGLTPVVGFCSVGSAALHLRLLTAWPLRGRGAVGTIRYFDKESRDAI
jgi:hypothetical protein